MKTTSSVRRLCIGLCLATAIPAIGVGQVHDVAEGIGGPLSGLPVRDAPFSADATTTARLTLRDGTRVDQTTTARYYRDSVGRVRVEFKMDGLPARRPPPSATSGRSS